MKLQFEEGEDYYYNADGLIVLTEKYHLQRGYCCGNGCKHCPYNYQNVSEPKRTALIKNLMNEKENN
jgi:hypothetical protein